MSDLLVVRTPARIDNGTRCANRGSECISKFFNEMKIFWGFQSSTARNYNARFSDVWSAFIYFHTTNF